LNVYYNIAYMMYTRTNGPQPFVIFMVKKEKVEGLVTITISYGSASPVLIHGNTRLINPNPRVG